MAIISLIVGLTAPRFGSGIDRQETRAKLQYIEDQFRQLPRRIRLSTRSLQLPADLKVSDLGDGMPVLEIPPNWTLSFSPALQISPLGACNASKLSIQTDQPDTPPYRYKIVDLSCELIPETP